MPRPATREDDKIDLLILIMIFEYRLPSFEYDEFHRMAVRYVAELKKRGMDDLGFYLDCVSGRYPQAEEALHEAVNWGYVSLPSHHGRFHTTYSERSRHRRLVRQTELTPDEWAKAEEAAKATYEALCNNTLEEEPAATE